MRRRAPGGDVLKAGSLLAGADLRAAQYRFVRLDAAGNVVQASTNERIIGVLQNRPNVNEPCTIIFCGESLLESGGSFAVGAWLRSDATGRAVATTTATDIVGAIALEAANAAGELVRVLVITPSPYN